MEWTLRARLFNRVVSHTKRTFKRSLPDERRWPRRAGVKKAGAQLFLAFEIIRSTVRAVAAFAVIEEN